MKKLLVLAFLIGLCGHAGAATYYISSGVGPGSTTAGDDANPGTEGSPWKTMTRVFNTSATPRFQGGDILIMRGGWYDTTGSGVDGPRQGTVPSGSNTTVCAPWPDEWTCDWSNPTTFKAYTGETPVFRRFIETAPAGEVSTGITEAQLAASFHYATPAECKLFVPQTPYPCWSGGGVAPGYLNWQQVAPYGYIRNYVFAMWGGNTRYVLFDGVHFDGFGIVGGGVLSLSCWTSCGSETGTPGVWDGPELIRFKNLSVINAIASCVSMPGAPSEIAANYQFINVKIGNCGVPNDTNYFNNDPAQGLARLSPYASFYHPWYAHTGHNYLINSETFNSGGTGLAADGHANVIIGNYVYGNAAYGVDISGGGGWLVRNNVFWGNGGIGIYHRGGPGTQGTVVENNTIIAGPRVAAGITAGYSRCIHLHTGAYGAIYQNNICQGYDEGVYAQQTYTLPEFGFSPNTILRNNLMRVTPGKELTVASGTAAPVVSGTVTGDPKLRACNNTACTDPSIPTDSAAKDTGYANGLIVDKLGNTRPVGAGVDIGAYEFCTSCTQVPTTAVITIQTNPGTGASITYSGGTCSPSSPGSGSTTFQVTCNLGDAVTFQAPISHNSNAFGGWANCSSTSGQNCTINLFADRTIVANFGTSRTLTVVTTGATSVPVTLPTDLNGQGSASTPTIIRSYALNSSLVITARGNVGDIYFASWSGCDSTSGNGGVTCTVNMTSDKTLTLAYGGSGCGVDKDNVTVGRNITLCAATNIRDVPNGVTDGLPQQALGETGTIVGGPTSAGGTNWIQGSFNSGYTGWLTTRNAIVSGSTPAVPSVAFVTSSSTNPEAVTTVNIPVNLSAVSAQTVTVSYSATGGTATPGGGDYALNPGVLTYAPGVTTQNIQLAITNDTISEPDETVQITISAPANANLGGVTVHTYTIVNDDAVSTNPPRIGSNVRFGAGVQFGN